MLVGLSLGNGIPSSSGRSSCNASTFHLFFCFLRCVKRNASLDLRTLGCGEIRHGILFFLLLSAYKDLSESICISVGSGSVDSRGILM